MTKLVILFQSFWKRLSICPLFQFNGFQSFYFPQRFVRLHQVFFIVFILKWVLERKGRKKLFQEKALKGKPFIGMMRYPSFSHVFSNSNGLSFLLFDGLSLVIIRVLKSVRRTEFERKRIIRNWNSYKTNANISTQIWLKQSKYCRFLIKNKRSNNKDRKKDRLNCWNSLKTFKSERNVINF